MTRVTRSQDTDAIVTAVLTASRALVAVSARSVAEVDDSISLAQFRALVVLHGHPSANLNRLAEDLAVNASTAMRAVDRLIAAGLVTRQDNPDNRREVVLELTKAGTDLVEQVTTRRRAEIARIVRRIPAEQRAGLVEALGSFADAAGEPPVVSW